MSQKTSTIILTACAAALLTALVVFAVLGRWDRRFVVPGATPSQTTTTQDAPSVALRMEIVTVTSSTADYVISAEYPTFPDQQALTEQIQSFVDESISDFRQNASANAQARRDTETSNEATPFQYNFAMSWSSAQLNNRYISVLMRVDAFEGGANLHQYLRSFNWDMSQNKQVTLADLFAGDSTYLQRISGYARQMLEGELGESTSAEFLDDGTLPTIENFSTFTFNEEVITIHFQKYQVAPGAAGLPEVVIPRTVEGLF